MYIDLKFSQYKFDLDIILCCRSSKECQRCSSEIEITEDGNNELCKDCFVMTVLNKFTNYFYNQHITFFNQNILIVHSESILCTALLHMLKAIIDGNLYNDSCYKIYYLYINGKFFLECIN